jgi:predicted ferric reductase
MLIRRVFQLIPIVIALAILAFVWSVPITSAGGWLSFWDNSHPADLTYRLFQLAGLTAFTLIGLQVATGPFMTLWGRLYGPGFYKFHAIQGLAVLLFALLHPLLLGAYLIMKQIDYSEFAAQYPWQLSLGPIALALLLMTIPTAASAVLWNKPYFRRRWHWIHLLNYLVFLTAFLHSISIGSDVSPSDSQLRPLWWTFFVIWIFAGLYRRVFRVVKEKSHGLSS